MLLTLDHVVVAVNNLDQAIQDYRDLGFTVLNGGVHANGATHNALVVFEDGTYIELLAKTGNPPKPDLIDFSVLVEGEGLVGYALGTDDIEADAARLKTNGIAIGEIVAGERRKPDGTLIQWKLLQIEPDGEAHGFAPFLIQDVTPRELRVPTDPAKTSHDNRALGIEAVEIDVKSFKAAFKRYTAILGEFPRGYGGQHVMIDLVVGGLLILKPEAITHDTWEAYQKWLSPHRIYPTDEEAAASEQFRSLNEYDKRMRIEWEQEQAEKLLRLAAIQNRREALYKIHLIRDADPDDRFMLKKTHNVRFRQIEGVSKTRSRDIFAGLEPVDWSAVTHAYGAATNVPDLLRMLTSESAAVRQRAYEELFNNVLHQGTVYPATLTIIPFMLRLLTTPNIPEKSSLFEFLLSASGREFEGEIDPNATYGSSSRAYRELNYALRAAFVKGTEIYIALLDDPDPVMRRYAASTLGRCFDHPNAESALRTRLKSEHDPIVRAELIESITKVWAREGKQTISAEQIAELETWRTNDEPPAVQFQAALALARAGNVSAALPTFYGIMSADIGQLKAYRDNSVMMIFFDGIDALMAADAWRSAFDWLAAQAAHLDPLVRKEIAPPLRKLGEQWRPAVQLGIPVLRKLIDDANTDVRLSAIGVLWRFGSAMEKMAIVRMSNFDPLPSVRQIALNHITNGQIPLLPSIGYKKLRSTTTTLIEQLTALIGESPYSANRRQLPEMLFTLGGRGAKAQSALPLIRQYAEQRDSHGWTLLEAVRAWWKLAPEDGEQITAAILNGLYPIPASIHMIDLLGDMKWRAAAAIPTLETIVNSEWCGDGFIGGRQPLDVLLDKALQDTAKRALRKIQKGR